MQKLAGYGSMSRTPHGLGLIVLHMYTHMMHAGYGSMSSDRSSSYDKNTTRPGTDSARYVHSHRVHSLSNLLVVRLDQLDLRATGPETFSVIYITRNHSIYMALTHTIKPA